MTSGLQYAGNNTCDLKQYQRYSTSNFCYIFMRREIEEKHQGHPCIPLSWDINTTWLEAIFAESWEPPYPGSRYRWEDHRSSLPQWRGPDLMRQLSNKTHNHLPNRECVLMIRQVEGHLWSHCVLDKEVRSGGKVNTENHHGLQVARSPN